uniref:VASt domain-containing protein n=1 Tax=Knipowitschia caucasica TaxID=637954 RepID=A0AAV2L3M2_KNICA
MSVTTEILGPQRVSESEQMDQVSIRSGGVGNDTADDSASLVDERWSDDEEESSDPQWQCLASPQTPLATYKQRYEEFKKTFKELPETEILIVDYHCALQRDILLQGRLYLSENCLCFYSNVFRGTKIILNLKEIMSMTREKTARLIPNAIQVCTSSEKFFFTSFSAREKSYLGVFKIWQNVLINKSLTSSELWQMVKQHYGSDLGMSHEEMESLQLSPESSMQTRSGGDDSRFERSPSLRLPGIEQGPLEASTPQTEDFPSPAGSQTSNSLNVNDIRNSPSRSRSPMLDRGASERVSKRSPLSLDLNANENGISGQSGSESIEEDDRLGLSQVAGRLYLNKVFHISASKMFEMLFTDSSFIRRFMDVRKITNPSFNTWQTDTSGNKKRTLNYTITISNPLIGKFSTATESQTLHKESREGQYYLVDAEVYTHDVPYHDYFYTHNRYYIIRNSKRKCRLRVYTDVKYKKQPWGLIKSFITKNSWSGIQDNFRQLEAELLEEEAELNQVSGDAGKGGLRRRRRTYSRSNSEHMKTHGRSAEAPGESITDPIETSPQQWNVNMIIAVMSVILLLLTLLNLGLFFKLWSMEEVAHRIYLSTKQRLRQRAQSSMEPGYGAPQGPVFPNIEDLHLLKTVLQDSINLLEQLRKSLLLLQQSFLPENETATSCLQDARLHSMKKRTKKVSEEETLCCCEYVNEQGERSHVAACCCNCEDLDDVCDRLLKREEQKAGAFSKVTEVLTDRIRVPWLWGGARKVDLSIIPPLVLLPVVLHIAALHFLLGALVLTALPALTRTKKGPGVVFPNRETCHSTVTYYTPLPEKDPAINGGKHEVMLMERTGVSEATEAEKERHHKNWCPACRLMRPPRAGHCRICGVCVQRMDHHCVWINSCVGQANHLSFLLTLIFFLLTSLYGICLVLQSVCPKQHIVTALFYCPGIYSEFSSALCFTCAWYSSLVTGGLLHLLLVQVINISYNVTEREARIAFREKTAQTAFWGLVVHTNVYSRGFWMNWSEFLSMATKVNLAGPADVV